MSQILVIEDNDAKWERVSWIVQEALPNPEISRARDLFEGEREIARTSWDLLILDMSLDIRHGGSSRAGVAHDYTGGLKILGQMYYDQIVIPTIIITGFDSFPTKDTDGGGAVLGLEDVEREAKRRLSGGLIGTVRNGPIGWEKEFQRMLEIFIGSCT